MFQFPVLIADIGGTTSRFAMLPGPDRPLSRPIVMATALHATPSMAIRSALDKLGGEPPRSAFLGVAGRVDGPVVRLTNARWTIDAAQIHTDLNLTSVTLVNDYVPVAAILATLDAEKPGDLVRIGPALSPGEGNRIALGPGTGLGAAACISVQNRHWLQPTEAGHVSFGACEAVELASWPLIDPDGGRIAAETVLSGPGLVRLYRAAARRIGVAPQACTPAEVVDAAASGDDEIASETIRLFVSLLGRFAGDLALVFNATGGVYLGSGILPRITGLLDGGNFRRAFESKAPFESVMARIPTFLITRPEPAILGLAAIARAPDQFMFEAHGWPVESRAFSPLGASAQRA